MASSIALVFSKVIDPKNPLHLDDSCIEETIDWEFGLKTTKEGTLSISKSIEKSIDEMKTSTALVPAENFDQKADDTSGDNLKGKNKISYEPKLIDPDEIIDPASLIYDTDSNDDEDNASDNSDSSSDSSLQPYDLSDDDTDLKRKFTQLVDVVGALRKTDDADGVSQLCLLPSDISKVLPSLIVSLILIQSNNL